MVSVEQVYGANWCSDTRRTKAFLEDHLIEYEWLDVDADLANKKRAQEISGSSHIPVVVFSDKTFFVEPTNQQLAEKLQLFDEKRVEGGGWLEWLRSWWFWVW